MTAEELKNSSIFSALKKNKKAQASALRLGKTEDWVVIKLLVAELKQTLLEATLNASDIKEIQKYKHLIRGMESVVLLPSLVNLVKETEKKDKESEAVRKAETNRKKYAPGTFIKNAVNKLRNE